MVWISPKSTNGMHKTPKVVFIICEKPQDSSTGNLFCDGNENGGPSGGRGEALEVIYKVRNVGSAQFSSHDASNFLGVAIRTKFASTIASVITGFLFFKKQNLKFRLSDYSFGFL